MHTILVFWWDTKCHGQKGHSTRGPRAGGEEAGEDPRALQILTAFLWWVCTHLSTPDRSKKCGSSSLGGPGRSGKVLTFPLGKRALPANHLTTSFPAHPKGCPIALLPARGHEALPGRRERATAVPRLPHRFLLGAPSEVRSESDWDASCRTCGEHTSRSRKELLQVIILNQWVSKVSSQWYLNLKCFCLIKFHPYLEENYHLAFQLFVKQRSINWLIHLFFSSNGFTGSLILLQPGWRFFLTWYIWRTESSWDFLCHSI